MEPLTKEGGIWVKERDLNFEPSGHGSTPRMTNASGVRVCFIQAELTPSSTPIFGVLKPAVGPTSIICSPHWAPLSSFAALPPTWLGPCLPWVPPDCFGHRSSDHSHFWNVFPVPPYIFFFSINTRFVYATSHRRQVSVWYKPPRASRFFFFWAKFDVKGWSYGFYFLGL